MDARLARFVERCEAAAAWRESIASRHGDDRSERSAVALRGVAAWARSDKQALKKLQGELGDLLADAGVGWNDSQEYAFTTYCLENEESRDDWLRRVRHAAD